MTRVVSDCMVYLQAAARLTGPAGACLQAVRDGRLELVILQQPIDPSNPAIAWICEPFRCRRLRNV